MIKQCVFDAGYPHIFPAVGGVETGPALRGVCSSRHEESGTVLHGMVHHCYVYSWRGHTLLDIVSHR